MYKIEKDIPLKPWGLRKVKYPLESMEVGDSFLAEIVERGNIASAVHHYGTRNNKRFALRKEGDEKVRVYRIK